jgi:peptidoglycan hydrolase-like protein with peptidoglycan-binding domain
MAEGLDFSWGRPGAAAIKASGRQFVCRYLGPARFGGKGMTAAEMNDYLNNGIAVVLNFESSGTNTTNYANGVADATFAQAQAVLLGQPNAVIYFSNDKQDTSGLVDYLHGVASVVGLNRVGLYGGIGAIQIAQGSNAACWYWQTYAWSGGRVAPGVHIYQYLNGQTINGASVDFDRNLQDNFGQIGSAVPSSGGGQTVGYNASSWATSQIQQALNDPRCGGYKLTVDNLYGPATTLAVHQFEIAQGLSVDIGIAGPQVVGRLAQLLGQQPPQPPHPSGPNLAVDGVYGAATCRAEQAALGVAQDGVRGHVTISAEQRRTGAKVDGIDGPDTTRHLQARLNGVISAGLNVDGVRGPLTIKALQTALNGGKF